jgi:sugar lactone lactonase YvrE
VKSVPLAGGAPATLMSSPANGIAIDRDFVYFTSSDSNVGKVSKSGGAVTSLATGQDMADGIAVDATSVYWVNAGSASGTGSVMKLTPK